LSKEQLELMDVKVAMFLRLKIFCPERKNVYACTGGVELLLTTYMFMKSAPNIKKKKHCTDCRKYGELTLTEKTKLIEGKN
jgi:hypothetical protein